MNLEFLIEFCIPTIVGICLCVGYIIKRFLPTDNKYIPLIVGVLGVLLAFWINGTMTPNILLEGLFSGLASSGLYDAFKGLIEKGE